MSRVEGRKDDRLLFDVGGAGFPHVVAMDAAGQVLAILDYRKRTIAGFNELMKSGQEFIELRQKADGGDAAARIEYFLQAMKFHHFKLAEAQKFRDTLKEVPAGQKAKIDAALAGLEMEAVTEPLRNNKDGSKVRELKVEAGRKFWAMHQAGRVPGEDNAVGNFYSMILDFAEHEKDIAVFETALKILRERFPKAQQKFFDAKTEILNRLKAEKEKPKEDKKDGDKK